MELFNRVVDAYPRTARGRLSTVHSLKESGGVHQLELVLMRKFADYSIQLQRQFPGQPLLTNRFRNNVCLVSSSMKDVLSDSSMESYTSRLTHCPGGEHAVERDLSSFTSSQLWAVEMVRLDSHSMMGNDVRGGIMESLYDRCAVVWVRNELPKYLGVDVADGWCLHRRALAVTDELVGEDRRKSMMGPCA
ncbi:hypothetical protein VNI00_013139 [Paramarasmius palmivorus]|uniref:Uncharacterized protein n=1 Tax=Paramarasmius palmivorus TaxID=297713 RepID=A0AAW0BYL7_9AGAR